MANDGERCDSWLMGKAPCVLATGHGGLHFNGMFYWPNVGPVEPAEPSSPVGEGEGTGQDAVTLSDVRKMLRQVRLDKALSYWQGERSHILELAETYLESLEDSRQPNSKGDLLEGWDFALDRNGHLWRRHGGIAGWWRRKDESCSSGLLVQNLGPLRRLGYIQTGENP